MKTSLGYTIPADLLGRFKFTTVSGFTHASEYVPGFGVWVYWGYLIKEKANV